MKNEVDVKFRYYSSGEIAQMIGIHRDKVNAEIRAGAPKPSVRIGRTKGFTKKDAIEFLRWCEKRHIESLVKEDAFI